MESDPFCWIFQHSIPEPTSGCFLSTSTLMKSGYSTVYFQGRKTTGHVVAYELVYGPVPAGLELDHLCRVKCCINPAHLEPVTHSENMRRAVFRKSLATHCKNGHPRTPENIRIEVVRDPVHGDRIKRKCAECHRISDRVKSEAKRRAEGRPLHPKFRTHCPHGHPYSLENTLISRGQRVCRECYRIRDRARKRN